MDKRKYPRVEICAQQRILFLSTENRLVRNIVLSRNLSASGFCFKATRPCPVGTFILVNFDDALLEDIRVNRARVIKAGKYFMARVVWSRLETGLSDPYHETGCAFVELAEGDSRKVELFTRLVTHDTADRLGPEF